MMFIPTAHAAALRDPNTFTTGAGTANSAVIGMFDQICNTLPFCDWGTAIVNNFAIKITLFVADTIAAIAVCVFIYAGIKIMMGQSSDEGIAEAKKMMTWAAGGLLLAMTGAAIVNYFAYVVLPQLAG